MHYDYRNDFPLLMQNKIIYIDNAATSQRPQCVIDAEGDFYKNYNANPLRGLYSLSVEATEVYENAREAVRKFIGAEKSNEIILQEIPRKVLILLHTAMGFQMLKRATR